MRRRAMLAMAMVGSPPLIVLDEAFNGLDVESAARVTRALREHASAGGSVLVSTHSEVTLRAVDRIVRLSGGRVDLDVPVESGVVPPGVMPD
jgi:ABC-type multidrug transport system ATPase subunit